MGKFNEKLVDSLDLLNHVLAVIFAGLAIFKFVELVGDNFIGAIFESVTIVGVGILTCGYIALMLNINNLLTEINNQQKD